MKARSSFDCYLFEYGSRNLYIGPENLVRQGMRIQNLLLFFLLLVCCLQTFAQKEWSNWYFNGQTAVSFTDNNTIKSKNGFINPPPDYWYSYYYNTYNGTAYSNPQTGEMRFLLAGRFAYDKNYDIIPGSINLRACPGDKSSFHIIPFQNNPDKFYIIQFQDLLADMLAAETGLQVRCPNAIGLGYSVLDLSKNNGLGEFTSMNTVLRSGIPDGITLIRHANGKDIWVVIHDWNSNEFLAYLFTDDGVSAPVVSAIGPVIKRDNPGIGGTLTASHNGKLIAGQLTGANQLDLYDFDKATGQLTGMRSFQTGRPPHSMVFSPDDTKLYYLGDYLKTGVFQLDLDAPDVEASLTKIGDDRYGYFFDMQMGPDGKIYISGKQEWNDFQTYYFMPVINCPNLAKYACNYNEYGFAMDLNYSYGQFPRFTNDYIQQPKAPRATEFSLGKDTAICFGSFQLSAPEGWQYYKWNTGETTRQITVEKPGLYYVLAGDLGFSCPTAFGSITLADAARKIDLGKDTVLCPGTSYAIHVPANYSDLLWNDGTTVSQKPVTSSSQFTIVAKDENGCTTRDTIYVGFRQNPMANFGRDTTLCENESLLLQLEPRWSPFEQSAAYLWQNGSTEDTLRVTQPGTYWGQVRYQGCTVSDTIRVGYVSNSSFTLGPDTTLCTGDSLLLKIPMLSANVLWSTGETGQQIVVKNPGTYWVRITNGDCTATDTIQVNGAPKPVLSLGSDNLLCAGQTITLQPAVPGATFLWQDGSALSSFEVKAGGLYWVKATLNGCSQTDSVTIRYQPLPPVNLGRDTILCEGESLRLNAWHSDITSYAWQDGSILSELIVRQAGRYAVTVKGVNGCLNADTITVGYNALPSFSLGADTVLCEGETLAFRFGLPAATYLWSTGLSTNAIAITEPGLYWLQVTQNGCSRRDSLLVNYKPLPVVSLGADTTLCEGTAVLLNVALQNATYQWQDGSKASSYPVSQPGTYAVTVTQDGCTATATKTVAFLYKPSFTLGRDTSLCTGLELVLDPGIRNAAFLWQDGSSAPVMTVKQPGVYQLTATNVCGSSTRRIEIAQGVCTLLMPNAFTPNGDGLNDVFRIKHPGFIQRFSLMIYNRWGEVIFRTENPLKGWDGKWKGVLQETGNFIWQITLTTKEGVKQSARGSVLLIR